MILPELIMRHILNEEIPQQLIDKLNLDSKKKFY